MAKDMVRHLLAQDLSEETVMSIPLAEARAAMIPFRVAAGFIPAWVNLLTEPSDNLKLKHSETDRVAGYGLSLAPATGSAFTPSFHLVLDGTLSHDAYYRIVNGWCTCKFATKGCRSACLASSGNGRYLTSVMGRRWKTWFLAERPQAFLRVLVDEIDRIPVEKWEAFGFTVSFRFNVLSDIPWESLAPWVLRRLADRGIRVYDYTKWPSARRDRAVADGLNYYLVDSVHERHTDEDIRGMARPVVVFDVKRGKPLPETFLGRRVIDADVSDARFLDEEGTVRGLRFKEVQTTKRAEAVASGFVRVA